MNTRLLDDTEALAARASRIGSWLERIERTYADELSRCETASPGGFDADPRQRPCEHLGVWRRGRLCIACDNTGWRRLAPGEQGVDPYRADVVTRFVVVESEASRKARLGAHIDAKIEACRRDRRIRLGIEVPEGRELATLRRVEALLGPVGRRVMRYRRAMPDASLEDLALAIPGRIPSP